MKGIACSLLTRKDRVSLDGVWDFEEDPDDVGESGERFLSTQSWKRSARVPCPWELQFEDLRGYCGSAWYRRSFDIPNGFRGKRTFLVFQAVDYVAKVWVNGHLCGEHEGGFLPFKFDITPHLQDAANTLTVKVTEVDDLRAIPAGKQSWYSRFSGIWQEVFLEAAGEAFIEDLYAQPDIDNGKATVAARVFVPEDQASSEFSLNMVVESPDGAQVVRDVPVPAAKADEQRGVEVDFDFDEVMLWDLETPNLYSISATLQKWGEPVDAVSDTFGMRKIEADGRYLRLNGKPIYIVGVTDQPDTPDRNVYKKEYSPPTDEEIKREIQTAKALGLNMLRKHVKCEHPRYLYWADRLGMLIWEEPPFFWTFGERTVELWTETLQGMIVRDRNHPSIVVWGLLNENWGVREQEWDDRQSQFARAAYELTKQLDPTRLIMGNSGGTQVRTDLHDRHTYISAPERHEEFRDFWQKVRYAGKPVLATEFGLPGPPELDTLRAHHDGEMPWWITEPRKEGDRDLQSRYLLPFEGRYKKWGFDEQYDDYPAFKLAHGRHNFEGMKYEIEQIRQNPDIAGYLITSFFDAFSEPFGLLDYYGDLKPHYAELPRLQQQDLLIIETPRRSFWSGDECTLAVYVFGLFRR